MMSVMLMVGDLLTSWSQTLVLVRLDGDKSLTLMLEVDPRLAEAPRSRQVDGKDRCAVVPLHGWRLANGGTLQNCCLLACCWHGVGAAKQLRRLLAARRGRRTRVRLCPPASPENTAVVVVVATVAAAASTTHNVATDGKTDAKTATSKQTEPRSGERAGSR